MQDEFEPRWHAMHQLNLTQSMEPEIKKINFIIFPTKHVIQSKVYSFVIGSVSVSNLYTSTWDGFFWCFPCHFRPRGQSKALRDLLHSWLRFLGRCILLHTLPETKGSLLKIGGWKNEFLFEMAHFQGRTVSFREGNTIDGSEIQRTTERMYKNQS